MHINYGLHCAEDVQTASFLNPNQ